MDSGINENCISTESKFVNYGKVKFVNPRCISNLTKEEKERLTINVNQLYSYIGLWSVNRKYSKQIKTLRFVLERSTLDGREFKRSYYVQISEKEIKDGFGDELNRMDKTTFRLEECICSREP